jgi:Flp pilus assembly pilin Flp
MRKVILPITRMLIAAAVIVAVAATFRSVGTNLTTKFAAIANALN